MEPITFNQQMLSDYFQLQPAWVKGRYNAETEMERRYLYNNIFSVFDFKLPKSWPMNYFRYFLFYFGSIASIYTKEFGWICQPYGVEKIDLYYQPSRIIVYNQFLKSSKNGIIGLNAEIIRIMDDYAGLDDLVACYATQLANIDKSVSINLMNANVTLYAEAENKKQADSIREAYSLATTGQPFVAINSSLLGGKQLSSLIANPKGNLIVMELEQARQEILNRFLRRVGIRTANYDKRAQMSDDEIRQSDQETCSICSVILENLEECFSRLNQISGLELSVRLRDGVRLLGKGKTDA